MSTKPHITTAAKLEGGVILKGAEGEFVIVAETIADQYGDHAFAVGKVVFEKDFAPFREWNTAYDYAESLL